MKVNVLLNFSPLSTQTQDPFSMWHSTRDVTKRNLMDRKAQGSPKDTGLVLRAPVCHGLPEGFLGPHYSFWGVQELKGMMNPGALVDC